jgi:hypothetical protein
MTSAVGVFPHLSSRSQSREPATMNANFGKKPPTSGREDAATKLASVLKRYGIGSEAGRKALKSSGPRLMAEVTPPAPATAQLIREIPTLLNTKSVSVPEPTTIVTRTARNQMFGRADDGAVDLDDLELFDFHFVVEIAESTVPLHCRVKAVSFGDAMSQVERIPNLTSWRQLKHHEVMRLEREA